jgi:hypothetical protein
MNSRRILVIILWLALLLATTSIVATKDLRGLNTDLAWNVISAGGGNASSASYSMEATLGQPIVGPSSSLDTRLSAGFWQSSVGYRIFLPILLR